MTPDEWLEQARRDAERRSLPALIPILEAVRQAIVTLRAADWNDEAGPGGGPSPSPRRADPEDRR